MIANIADRERVMANEHEGGRLMTPDEVRDWLEKRAQHRISLVTLDRWRRTGLLKSIKIGRAVRYRLADVRNLLAERKP